MNKCPPKQKNIISSSAGLLKRDQLIGSQHAKDATDSSVPSLDHENGFRRYKVVGDPEVSSGHMHSVASQPLVTHIGDNEAFCTWDIGVSSHALQHDQL